MCWVVTSHKLSCKRYFLSLILKRLKNYDINNSNFLILKIFSPTCCIFILEHPLIGLHRSAVGDFSSFNNQLITRVGFGYTVTASYLLSREEERSWLVNLLYRKGSLSTSVQYSFCNTNLSCWFNFMSGVIEDISLPTYIVTLVS